MDRFDRIDGIVKQFGYRSALIGDVFMTLPRSACRELEERLAEAAGVQPDNHTVYEITHEQYDRTDVTYLMFSDLTVRFGRKVEERRW